MSIRDYDPLAIIGKGAFGEVRVCREKATGSIVAIKKMKKDEMHKKNQIIHMRTEREILTTMFESGVSEKNCTTSEMVSLCFILYAWLYHY